MKGRIVMLLERNDNTFDGGILDVICILHNVNTNRYHVAFFEESPMPGPVQPIEEMIYVRLKSKMHHTVGAATLEGAMKHLEEFKSKIHVQDKNIWLEPKDWDGEVGIVWVVPKW